MSRSRRVCETIAAVEGWRRAGSALELRLRTSGERTARLILRAVWPGTWRLTVLPPGATLPRPGPMVVPGTLAGLCRTPLTARSRGRRLLVSGPSSALEIGLDPFDLRFRARDGSAVLTADPGDVDGLGRPAAPPLGFVPGPNGATAVTASFHLRPEERLYGLGERFTRLDKAGQKVVSWIADALGSTSGRSHKSVPFLWSSRGFGVFVDTGARIVWDLGVTSLRSWSLEVEAPVLDAYVFCGPGPDRILAAYASLTGRTPAVPDWSFGLWLSSGGTYRDQASIEALLAGIERHRLPADVIHIDPWWMRWRKYCDFAWDRRAFPDPEGLVRRVHRLGLKLCLWEHPYISIESDLYADGRDKGYFVRRLDGDPYVIDYGLSLAPRPDGRVRLAGKDERWNAPVAIVDFTHPGARAWFQGLHRPLLRAGVDVFKTDFGEDIPADALFHDGRTGAEMHNLYPLLYNAAVFEVTAEEKGRGLVWARSGTAGCQRFPVGWSGDPASDWDSLAATVRGGLSAGLSGLALWSHDIGGYRGRPDPELYVRWAQFGLFSSHSRMHGDSPREPWAFGEEALAIVRRFAQLRYRLFPYVKSAALEARDTGLPVLRALPLAFPDDPNVAAWDHEYMFGPCFLVAPVIRPLEELTRIKQRRRRGAGEGPDLRGGTPLAGRGGPKCPVYLPAGEWIDFWTGRSLAGPATVDAPARLRTMPLFVRAGAIVPMMKTARRTPDAPVDPLILELYPRRSGRSSYALIEERGQTTYGLYAAESHCDLEWAGPASRTHIIRPGRGLRLEGAMRVDGGRRERLDVGKRGLVLPAAAAAAARLRLFLSRR